MVFIKGNYRGVPIKIECNDLNDAATIINTMDLDNPLKFDPVHETLLLMFNLNKENKIKELDPAFLGNSVSPALDFIFGTCFPCIFCGEMTAHGVSVDSKWISICRVCAVSKTYNDINAKDDKMYQSVKGL